jgi:serine/threonine-protein kinase
MARLAPGSRLGRYEIVRLLGVGAMGEVYLAEDPQIGRKLAIKTVRIEEGRPHEIDERKKRLLREARAAGRLLHTNIVTLFDAGEDQGVLYLAFEWVDGTDLAERLAVGPPLSLGEALAIVRQTALGLDSAHRQGVVHRDIKPSNLMITSSGDVKIADFGIAKVADQSSDLTMTGSVVGSPHYLSPEQIRGEELDGRSDIFSLGVLLYEILCRKRPFEGDTLTTLVYQILHHEPASPIVARPDLGPRIENLVRRMMHKNRDERFATAREVADEIVACERELAPARLAAEARPATGELESTRRLDTPAPVDLATAETRVQARSAAPPSPPPPPPPPPGAAAAIPTGSPPSARPSRLPWVIAAALALVVLVIVGGLAARKIARDAANRDAPRSAEATVLAPTATPQRATRTPQAEGGTPLQQPEGEPPTPVPTPTELPTPPPTATPRPEPTAAPRTPTPAPTAAPTPEPTPVATPEPEETEEAPPIVDREMRTGMSLSFEIEPETAIVRVGRIVIGQAGEWDASKRNGRAYDLARPGIHVVRIFGEGRTYLIRIDASRALPSPTKIAVDLTDSAKRRRR